MITRVLEWTGVPFSLFGMDLHITIYLPLLLCIPICLCYGFFWAAIPAYFSTFFVAYIGDMPMHWILIFSFANPIGLAMLVMVYRITPARLDLKSMPAALFFVVASFLSALAGSIGSFIWTYTNQVNLHDFFKVWQGWWLGGFLQSVFICGPILYFLSAWLLKTRDQMLVEKSQNSSSRNEIKRAIIVVISILVLYIWLAFQINLMNIEEKLLLVQQADVRQEIQQATRVINFPVIVFISITIFLGYFFFYFTDYWHLRLQQKNTELKEKNERMYFNSIHDTLTKVHNRSYLFEVLPKMFKQSREQQVPSTLLMLDLDHFKSINDNYGHQAGDLVLQNFAQSIMQVIDKEMVLARFGGEEFCLLAANTNQQQGEALAQRIIQRTRQLRIDDKPQINITLSIGGHVLSDQDENIDDWIEVADNALYQAKNNGRDRYFFM